MGYNLKTSTGFTCVILMTCSMLFFAGLARAQQQKGPGGNIVHMELKSGTVVLELRPDLAPKHVERFKKLIREEFYSGLKFHRVIEGFMAQTGDPQGTGSGGSSYPDLEAEFSTTEKFKRGTLGMARTSDPDSANSQFFITFAATPWLDGKYTIFGNVKSGMKFVDQIRKGHPRTGQLENLDVIISMRLVGDNR